MKKRCTELELLLSLLDEMSQKIRFQSIRSSELIAEAANEHTFDGCCFLKNVTENIGKGMTINEAWCCAAGTTAFLGEAERQTLISIGERLGGSDTEGTVSMLALGSSMLSRELENARAQYEQKSKMVLSVWALCGIGAGIIII